MWDARKSKAIDHFTANVIIKSESSRGITVSVGEHSGSDKYYSQIIGNECALKMAVYIISKVLENRHHKNFKVDITTTE